MKKFMKGCAITALVLVVVGATFAFTAGTVRGSSAISEVVEQVTGGRVHVNFGWGLPWGIYVDDHRWFGDNDWLYDLDDLDDLDIYDSVHEIFTGHTGTIYPEADEPVNRLDIQLGGCSFSTRVSDTGDFYLKTQNMDKLQAYVEGGELHIKGVNSKVRINGTNRSVVLYVPEDQYYDEIDISLGAGEMTFNGLNADEINLEVGAGHIIVRDVKAKELTASVGLGQLEVLEMDVEKLDAEVGMGELVCSGDIGRSAVLECAMGNLEMRLNGSEKDYNFQVEAAAGNVDIGRSSYSGLAYERWVNNNASKTLDIECSMGNVSITFAQ